MPGIFICYRREDSAGHSGRLFDRLRDRLGSDRVFMDVAGIDAGGDFMDAIEEAVGACAGPVAALGPGWLTSADASGRTRLSEPDDLIRLEIGAALARKVRVIPVLIGGALLPRGDQLPDELKALVRRQVVELRDTRWDDDADHLGQLLEKLLASAGQRRVVISSVNRGSDQSESATAIEGTGEGRLLSGSHP